MKVVKLIFRTILSIFLIFATYSIISCVVDLAIKGTAEAGNALAAVVILILALIPIMLGNVVVFIISLISLLVHIRKFKKQLVAKYEIIWLSIMVGLAITNVIVIIVSSFVLI